MSLQAVFLLFSEWSFRQPHWRRTRRCEMRSDTLLLAGEVPRVVSLIEILYYYCTIIIHLFKRFVKALKLHFAKPPLFIVLVICIVQILQYQPINDISKSLRTIKIEVRPNLVHRPAEFVNSHIVRLNGMFCRICYGGVRDEFISDNNTSLSCGLHLFVFTGSPFICFFSHFVIYLYSHNARDLVCRTVYFFTAQLYSLSSP